MKEISSVTHADFADSQWCVRHREFLKRKKQTIEDAITEIKAFHQNPDAGTPETTLIKLAQIHFQRHLPEDVKVDHFPPGYNSLIGQ